MNEEKRQEIKTLILSLWDKYEDTSLIATEVMNGYIFGTYSSDEHYLVDDIAAIVSEIVLEKAGV